MEKINEQIQNFSSVLFPYAYNIIGSVEEAKDIVQDVLSKHFALNVSTTEIVNQKNYLITSVVNHSINSKKRKNKFSSDVERLPEPIATEESDIETHLKDIVKYSLLVLLEQLNVKERAVFVLKEAFHYSHEEIAQVISSTSENSRKLLSRAKAKINPTVRDTSKISNKEASAYLKKYVEAIRNGDTEKLEELFCEDIKVVADGGERVKVISNVTTGVKNCILLMLEVYKKFQRKQSIKFIEVNHHPALLYLNKSKVMACQIFSFDEEGKIYSINSVIDPVKLKNVAS